MFSLDVYKDQDAPAFALLAVTLDKFGLESLETDPSLLRKQIESEYGLSLSQLQLDKLQAAMSIMTTDSFYTDWRVFEHTCWLFNNHEVDAELVNPLEAELIASALSEATLIRSCSDDSDIRYDDEVSGYCGHVFYEYGLSQPPTIFPSALMPYASRDKRNDQEKSDSLLEIFEAHAAYVLEYVDKISH